ncbi:MAG TPA: polymer-forming cytoskeletal protein [Mobilitalea sp.]|nr:polymer-forming cytoskeletal protein [Mobilitalea sp.]
MSFFKEFKEDLSKAVNELLPEELSTEEDTEDQLVNTLDSEEAALEETSDSEKMKEWLDEFTLEDEPNDEEKSPEYEILMDDTVELEEAITEKPDNIINEQEDIAEEPDSITEVQEDMAEEPGIVLEELIEEEGEIMDENIDLDLFDALNADEEDARVEDSNNNEISKLRSLSVSNDDEVTVISKGTTINGSISSDGSLDIMGSITGDIECLGKLSITGKVNGNSTAAEVYVNTERMEGSINSEGSVKIGLGTVVIGDIIATSGVIAGAVKGEIDVNGPIVIDSTAIIKGNIKAKSVQINNGAVIEGFCSLSYSAVDVDNIFE